MNRKGEIKYLTHDEIDFYRWDLCIANSSNGIIYAFSWYLNCVCPNWEALVWGNYDYVMPLTANRKYGFSYLYQPAFTQQGGVFSPLLIEPEITISFLEAIPSHFNLVEINLNPENVYTGSSFNTKQNRTYMLDLNAPYESIIDGYSINTTLNIRKAAESGITIARLKNPVQFLSFYQTNITAWVKLKEETFQNLSRIIESTTNFGVAEMLGAFNPQKELTAVALFVRTHHHPVFLAAASNEEGYENRSMFLLIDSYIRNNAGKTEILDFEGSNIDGIAQFYKGFGAVPFTYYSIRRNRLPLPLKWIKKLK
ncbi:MAG: hypothetical protein Q8862_04890 [Bacteroidota bacterium]|nr:hypothetical protein [Bacteroidota bacterium]